MMVKFECGCALIRKALALCTEHRDSLEHLVKLGYGARCPWGQDWMVKKSLGARKGVGVSSKTAGR